jgi:hypothetical protein
LCGIGTSCEDINNQLVLVLHQLCIDITRNPTVLESLFCVSQESDLAGQHNANSSSNQFILFTLLVPFVHREDPVAQQARDDLLLMMSLSSLHDDISQCIINKSDFCPLLATGLSGLYSSLPRRIDYPSDDWNQITAEDIANSPSIAMFLNSLEFCNAVMQVAHPAVCKKLQKYVYDGFLVSVLGPALHQNSIVYVGYDTVDDNPSRLTLSSVEEVIAATAYIELFVRKITNPGLLTTFIHFILRGKVDEVDIADSLISRIGSCPRLCMVTLTLFKTLIELNSEEVMFQLIFRYLIPCTHVMVSQQKCIRDIDMYSQTAAKLISLTPQCCLVQSLPPEDSTVLDEANDLHSSTNNIVQLSRTPSKWFPSFLRRSHQPSVTSNMSGSPVPPSPSNMRHSVDVSFESNYIEYLFGARVTIEQCAQGCRNWSALYDGENPWLSRHQDTMEVLSSVEFCDIVPDEYTQVVVDGNRESHLLPSFNTLTGSMADNGVPTVCVGEASDAAPAANSKLVPDSLSVTHISSTDDLESFLRHLARISSRTDVIDGIDVLTEFDAVIGLMDETSGNIGSGITEPPGQNGEQPSQVGEPSDEPQVWSDKPLGQNGEQPSQVGEPSDEPPVWTDKPLGQNGEQPSQVVEPSDEPPVWTDKPLGQRDVDSVQTSELLDQTKLVYTEKLSSSAMKSFCQVKALSDNVKGVVTTCQSSVSCVSAAVEMSTEETPEPWSRPLIDFSDVNMTSAPTVGPLLSAILSRLELMVQNPLYVNLQLTGLLSRLACFQQPLLKSILLSHSLVFQPSIKSLLQVLTVVRHRLDSYLLTVSDYESLLQQANQYLLWRDEVSQSESDTAILYRRDSSVQSLHPTGADRKKSLTLTDLFRKSPSSRDRLTVLDNHRGVLYISHTPTSPGLTPARTEALEVRTKNAIYCAIVFREFLKELAAISQEHLLVHSAVGA